MIRIRAMFGAIVLVAAAMVGAPLGMADPIDTLRDLMPEGYGPDGCIDLHSRPSEGVAAEVFCGGDGSVPGGNYLLLVDQPWLATWFPDPESEDNVPCTTGMPPVAAWSMAADAPDVVRGRITCEFSPSDDPEYPEDTLFYLHWTRDEDLFYGVVHATGCASAAECADSSGLYEWWRVHGNHPANAQNLMGQAQFR